MGFLQLEVFEIDQARLALRKATEVILEKEKAYALAVGEAADAEGVYRTELADAFHRRRGEGQAVQEAEIGARGEVVVASSDRDRRPAC